MAPVIRQLPPRVAELDRLAGPSIIEDAGTLWFRATKPPDFEARVREHALLSAAHKEQLIAKGLPAAAARD